ncbi:MAG: hypothetical protein ACOYJE_07825 [Bacteroidaceae bacterium]|jgi:hypothetical protein
MNHLTPLLLSLLLFSLSAPCAQGKEAVSLSEAESQSAQKAKVTPTAEEQNLKRKATRRNPDGYKELARYYIEEYRFSDAREALDSYKKYAKNPSCQAEEQTVETGLRLMMGIVDVVVIDSIVTNKSDFLQAYKLDADAGKLFRTADFFAAEKKKNQAAAAQQSGQTAGEAADIPSVRPIVFHASTAASADSAKADSQEGAYEGTLFLTGLGKNILYGDKGKIYSSTSRLNEWSKAQELSAEVNDSICNYPFLCADGQTLYFASTGHGSLGGYDIFITRFSSEANDYLRPDNIGMPFNSPYNDYMMALDEITGLGWFASDRYQPEGKVCVYIFIPDANRKIIDIENTDKEILRKRAQLSSIKSTWISHEQEQQQGMAALQEVRNLNSANDAHQKQIDFYLVINDQLTYTSYLDFHSDAAAQKAEEWQSDCAKLEALKQSLAKSRDLYEAAPSSQQKKISLNILDLEKQVRTLEATLPRTENEVRKLEIEALQ